MARDVLVLWRDGDWRCEWHAHSAGTARLEVYRGDLLATAEATPTGEAAQLRATVLRRRVLQGHLTVEHPAAEQEFWVETDQFGLIINCSEEALPFLGYTAGNIRGRSLLLMFLGDRPGPYQFGRVMSGHPIEREGSIRARDEQAGGVRYRIELAPHALDDRPVFHWRMRPFEPQTV
jgi:hypothetical protein